MTNNLCITTRTTTMTYKVLLLIVILFVDLTLSRRSSKAWVMTRDMREQYNWQGDALPCAGRAVVFPKKINTPAFLASSLSASELHLPLTGEVILGDSSDLTIDPTRGQQECVGRTSESKWIDRGIDYYWSPNAWGVPNMDHTHHSPSSAVPHIHRPPCIQDHVFVMHQDLSLSVLKLEPPQVTIASLTINFNETYNKNLTTSQFALWLQSPEGGKRVFGTTSDTDGGAPIYIEDDHICNSLLGCPCRLQEHAAKASTRICQLAKPCPTPKCSKPINMEGFCCPTCGADIGLSTNQGVLFDRVETIVMQAKGEEDVDTYVGMMDDGRVHVFITPGEQNKADFAATATTFVDLYKKEPGSDEIQLSVAEGTQRAAQASARKAQVTSGIVGTVIFIVLCVVAVGGFIYYKKNRSVLSEHSFSFRRMSRHLSLGSVTSGRRPSSTSTSSGNLRFVNPVFNQSLAALSVQEESEDALTLESCGENPMYAAIEEMNEEELKVMEETNAFESIDKWEDDIRYHNELEKTNPIGTKSKDLEAAKDEEEISTQRLTTLRTIIEHDGDEEPEDTNKLSMIDQPASNLQETILGSAEEIIEPGVTAASGQNIGEKETTSNEKEDTEIFDKTEENLDPFGLGII